MLFFGNLQRNESQGTNEMIMGFQFIKVQFHKINVQFHRLFVEKKASFATLNKAQIQDLDRSRQNYYYFYQEFVLKSCCLQRKGHMRAMEHLQAQGMLGIQIPTLQMLSSTIDCCTIESTFTATRGVGGRLAQCMGAFLPPRQTSTAEGAGRQNSGCFK